MCYVLFSKEHKKFIKILDDAFHSDLVSKVHSASFFIVEDKAMHKGRFLSLSYDPAWNPELHITCMYGNLVSHYSVASRERNLCNWNKLSLAQTTGIFLLVILMNIEQKSVSKEVFFPHQSRMRISFISISFSYLPVHG